jgi:FAD/FMN-containing dehydrogenase
MVELAEYALKLGAIIYKPPSWAAEMMWGKADPGFVRLMKLIKRAIDPKGIMNPGRLGL